MHSLWAPIFFVGALAAACVRFADAAGLDLATSVLAPVAPWQGCVNVTAPAGSEVALCHYTDESGLRLGVAVRVDVAEQQAVSWAGVGLSSTGGMKGADMIIASQSGNATAPPEVKDYWSAGFFSPAEDTLGDVTTLAAGSTERNATHGATMWFVASRPLARAAGRCDGKSQDLDVHPGRDAMLIYAFGTGSGATTVAAPTHRGWRRVTVRLAALPTPLELQQHVASTDTVTSSSASPEELPAVDTADEQRLQLGYASRAENLTVPSAPTSYLCRLVEFPAEERLVTHINSVFETNLVHHMVLYGCEGSSFAKELPRLSALPGNQWNCGGEVEMMPKGCKRFMWGKAFSQSTSEVTSFPAGKAMPIGGPKRTHGVFQVHFDNPHRQEGVAVLSDSFTLTHVPADTPGLATMGTLTVGVAPITAVDSIVIPPGREALLIDSICPIECTMQLPPGGVEIVYATEHAHTLARSLGMDIHRGTEVIPVSFLEHWDFDQGPSALPPLVPGTRLMPGDILRKWCTFDSRGETNTTRGGQGTSDEMCVGLLTTSPATPFDVCIDLKDAPFRYDTALHSFTSKPPAMCYPGSDFDVAVLPEAGKTTRLADLVENETKQSDMLDYLRLLDFYDPAANAVPDSPGDHCGLKIPGNLSRPPPRVGAEDAVDTAISLGGGSACGPANRGNALSCPTPAAMIVTVAFWATSILVGFLVFRRHFKGTKLPRPRRNVTAYFLNLLVTTTSLPVVLIAGAPLLFVGDKLDDPSQRLVWFFGFVLVSALYLWELVYRLDINPSLMVHHLCTITFAALFAISLYDMEEDTQSDFMRTLQAYVQNDRAAADKIRALNEDRALFVTEIFRVGIILVLPALTEQPSFVALLMHRATHRHTNAAFRVAAIVSGVSKTALFIWGMERYSAVAMFTMPDRCSEIRWCSMWMVLYPALGTLLFLTQLWATYILHVLSKRTALRPHDANQKTASVEEVATRARSGQKVVLL